MFKIKLIKSAFMDEKETRRSLADFILKTDRFSMAEQCREFEESFAKKQERKYSVFVNSGSSANLLLIQSLLNLGRLKKGDRVGISALTWSTNVMPLIQLGLLPVALDVEINTLNVSSKTIEPHVKNLKAIFITNALGFCSDIEEIRKICEDSNILLLEDNCEALGSRAYNRLLGNFGLASTFSFFLGHHISTLEGGMIVTDDQDLYEMMVLARAHGWDRQLGEDKKKELREKNVVDDFYALYTFYDLGYNIRPTEINGFLGNIQIKYWDKIVSERVKNFQYLDAVIKENGDLVRVGADHMQVASTFAVPVVAKTEIIHKDYRKKFEDNLVEIRPIISGDITKQPFFKKYIGETSCPNADLVHKQSFYFGNNPEITTEELVILASLLHK